MTSETTNMILQLVLSILGILIPFGIKYAIDHIGKSPVKDAVATAELAKEFIIKYFTLFPNAKKDVDNIIQIFKDRILKTTKLTDAELNYLWEQMSADIIKALKIELNDTKVTMMFQNKVDINKKQKLLFK